MTRTVEEIVEANTGGIEDTALWIYRLQVDADNWVDQWRDPNKPGHPIDWDLVDHAQMPREFVEAVEAVATYEVRL